MSAPLRTSVGAVGIVVLCACVIGARRWEARIDSKTVIEPSCFATARHSDRSVPWAYFGGPRWLYISQRAVMNRLRLAPGEAVLGAQREPMASFQRFANNGRVYGACTILPAHQVWVVSVRFSRPQQFISARYAYGIALYSFDAITGNLIEGVIKGKSLAVPLSRPRLDK